MCRDLGKKSNFSTFFFLIKCLGTRWVTNKQTNSDHITPLSQYFPPVSGSQVCNALKATVLQENPVITESLVMMRQTSTIFVFVKHSKLVSVCRAIYSTLCNYRKALCEKQPTLNMTDESENGFSK